MTPDVTDGEREKRRAPRIRVERLVRAAQSDPGTGFAEVTGRTLDLTEGGVRIEAPNYLPFLSDVQVDLALGEEIVKVGGRIVYLRVDDETNNFLVGIAFHGHDEELRAKIRGFLAARDPHSLDGEQQG